MTEDITSLQIRILYDSVTEAERRLKKLEGTATKTGKAASKAAGGVSKMVGSVVKLAAAYISLRTASAALRSIVRTTAEFQQLNAALQTATGSAENAAIAFEAVKDFAVKTPYDLQQATSAFISLVNRGLTPSERALTSYGNTASAMTFQLEDMVLAVSNAAAGQYRTLLKFGIRAKKEGDNVSFTFRNVTKTVKNTAAEIEKYFIELGENNFANGMDLQMQTLTGAFSNLEDAWEIFAASIGEHGLGDIVENSVRYATVLLEDFTAAIESGQVGKIIESWGESFDGFGKLTEDVWSAAVEGMSDFIDFADEALTGHEKSIQEKAVDPWDNVRDVLSDAPTWFAEMVRLAFASLDQLSPKIYEIGSSIRDSILRPLEAAGAGSQYGKLRNSEKTNPLGLTGGSFGSGPGIAGSLADSNELRFQDLARQSNDNAAKDRDIQNFVNLDDRQLEDNITEAWDKIITETSDAMVARESAITDAQKLREDYEAKRAASNDGKDRLEGFGVNTGGTGGTTGSGGGKSAKGGGKGGGDEAQAEFTRLAESLGNEERLISASYKRRFDLIQDNTRAGSAYQAELQLALSEQYEAEQEKRLRILQKEPETMFQAYEEERRILTENYEIRKDIILSATEITEEERLRLLAESELKYTAMMREAEGERNNVALGLASDFFGNISTMAASFGSKGAKVAKAAAVAQTTVKTYESATSAYAALAGIPYVGPALGVAAAGAAIASGLANVAAIKSTNYSGAFATGGAIPPGGVGLVGEAGPEFVRGPAFVTSARATADRGGGGGGVVVNVTNNAGAAIDVQERKVGDETIIALIVDKAAKKAEANITQNIRKGGNQTAAAFEDSFKLSRVAR